MISRRMMMNDKIVTQSGKQLVLEKCKGSYFNEFSMYGKSTQVKTTGVNLANGMDNVYKKEQSGQQKQSYCWGYSLGGGPLILDKPLKAGTYTFSFYSDATASIYLAKAPYVTGQFVQYSVNQKVTGDIKNGLQRYFCPFQLTDERDLIGIYSEGYTTCFGGMINFGDKPLPYEPYTGGKPSPSPEYPQKIVSAGESGSITVEVAGRNLIDYTKAEGYAAIQFVDSGFIVGGDESHRIINLPCNIQKGESYTIDFKENHLLGSNNVSCCLPGEKYSVSGNATQQYGIAKKHPFIAIDDYTAFSIYHEQENASVSKTEVTDICLVKTGMDTDYTPYVDPQSLTLATPNGLPGIPVATGGNYVDETGQQWICDEIDLSEEERVRRIDIFERVTFTIHPNYEVEGSQLFRSDIKINDDELSGIQLPCMCNKMMKAPTVLIENKTGFYAAYGRIFARIKDVSDADTFNQMMADNVFLVQRPDPIVTPLSPEEIAAYRALHTYEPTTTITNDAGAGMAVSYRKVRG